MNTSNAFFRLVALLGWVLLASVPTVPAAGVEPVANVDGDAIIAKCTRILRYGDNNSYFEPSKTDAVVALGVLGSDKALPVLIEFFENVTDQNLRMQIVRAMGLIGSPQAVPYLEKALQDNYPHVRRIAALGLKKITGKDYEYDKTGLPQPRDMLRAMMPPSKPVEHPAGSGAP